ncbi:LysR family transcriptional regulator [Shewanella sp. c952]|uniref:LysR family transcriptional regulator n=1 Tax=Shewanella sp. c952 TaxID=2815913 RepID=UPI001BBAD546|nr:LysR family transcriptional regulator [Shewanella sp. c952]GIU12454.1 LysR family transcriptional regulator [Shewanella sp. c952]
MSFSLEQLLAFVTVYEQKAFSKAAVKLNKHRTTIGQVITNLEDQLAITLFERVGRTVEPTEDATLLYHYAKQAIEQTRTFDRVALSLSFGELESVTIAYSSFIPQQLLTSIRSRLNSDFPSMRVNLLVRSKSEIKQGIQDGAIHFGMVNIFESKLINSIDSVLMRNMPFVPFTSIDSTLAQLPSDQTFNKMKSTRQFVLKSMLDDDMSGKVILSSNYEVLDQQTLIIRMVQEGLGWALLPRSTLRAEYYSENIVQIKADQIKEAVNVPVSLWCPHSKQVGPVKQSIVQCITDYIEAATSGLRG